jgi:cellulose synthase/poly-beta-1,6-N-acetylglucosamine synthase-like glycosyltransferase/glycosyltransferase involved in cell wall biosynthesis/O-antigen/teichoic acid export membrane protein
MTNGTLSIIIPAYNEASRIENALDSVERFIAASSTWIEVIVVDDGSSDETAAIARRYASTIKNLRVLVNEENRGKGYSVKRGMLAATGDYLLFMDADNSVDISHIEAFMAAMRQGHDVVIGSIAVGDTKHVSEHNGWHRRLLGDWAHKMVELIAVPGIRDTQRGFKLFSARAAAAIFPRQTIDRFGFDIEVLVIARENGFSMQELPVVWNNPAGSKVTIGSYPQTLMELARISYNRILGRYAAEKAPEPVRVKAVGAKRSTAYTYLRGLVFGPEQDPHMSPIMSGTRQTGFHYRGNEFVHHANLHINESAFFNLLRYQKVLIGLLVSLLAFAFFFSWQVTLITIFGALTILYFFDLLFSAYVVFQSYKVLPEIRFTEDEVSRLWDEECPSYTIFCPLYKEWRVVPQFVEAMQKLDYPPEKLQILFLLEENDAETIEKISDAGLPPHFQIVVVPHSNPKTKPKAMNYGLNYVTGDYVVVYDAEDVPEPDQLKKAVLAFRKLDNSIACVQAKLNFYNPSQNILTRLFTAEYSLWFDLVLPGFQSIAAPIPLGGTSNHFRATTLRELGGWDAFNVTEDCDLGMRLAKRGYKTAIIDSTTHEEANSDVLNWYNQRSRWIKGYIQTYFVHMRNPKSYFGEDGNWKDFFLFQLIVGGKILSLFINPIMWVITICYFLFRAHIGTIIESFFPGPILYIGVFSLVVGNFLYVYYYMVGCVKRGYDGLIKYVFLIPLYWLGMSVAAWKAMYEVIVKPHYWAKTVHGLHLAPQAAGEAVAKKSAFDVKTLVHKQIPQIAIPLAPKISAPVVASIVAEKEPELVQILNEDLDTQKESWLARGRRFAASGAGLLVISSVLANFINFGFNAYLGRVLSLADFGTITIVNIFVYLLSLFTGALSSTTTHEVSFFEGSKAGSGSAFFKRNWLRVFLAGLAGVFVWVLFMPDVGSYFNISNPLIIIAFTPVIVFSALGSLNSGYLQGTFSFASSAVVNILEVLIKLGLAITLVTIGLSSLSSLAIPGSMIASWVISTSLALLVYRRARKTSVAATAQKAFSLSFYSAALVSGISVAAFLTSDVILAKHYLSIDDAGRYALLSLVGKMIFFFGSLLGTFIMPLVARAEGEKRDPSREFNKILGGTAILTIGAAGGLALGGFYFVPLLLGAHALAIVPYVPLYSFAMLLFTISSTIALYGLARKRYIFPLLSFIASVVLWLEIAKRHASIGEFVSTIALVNLFAFALIVLAYLFYDRLSYLLRNFTDFFSIFQKLPPPTPIASGKMNLLVFNWRDSESVFAGGAETYIHALAERWVADGHSVTLFTSNDGKQKPHGFINGVRVVRRGGFYGVYALAPLYYFFKFRGKFDAIIDCENGIPFFAPLYAKEPVYCLLHHIHQEVFRKSLIWPFSALAQALEKNLMPVVYKNSAFVTVSESSKKEMQVLRITNRNIEVIYPGIDLTFLKPGEKSPTPQVAYVGRLKEYKSVDVLINAFASVIAQVPEAKLVIAGGGDDCDRLKKHVSKLKLQKHVSFLGKVSEEKKRQVLQESWVCVNPSMMEGWGITVIEANACGTPIIAADVPGLRDSVRDRETGFLVPHGDATRLAESISFMLKDNALRKIISTYALAWAQNFAWEKSSEKLISVVSSLRQRSAVPASAVIQQV